MLYYISYYTHPLEYLKDLSMMLICPGKGSKPFMSTWAQRTCHEFQEALSNSFYVVSHFKLDHPIWWMTSLMTSYRFVALDSTMIHFLSSVISFSCVVLNCLNGRVSKIWTAIYQLPKFIIPVKTVASVMAKNNS